MFDFSWIGDLIGASADEISKAEANDTEIRESSSPWNDSDTSSIDDDSNDPS